MKLIRSFALMAVVLVPIFCHAQENGVTYWIAPDGLDSNPGSQEAPFKTISRGAKLARRGYSNGEAGYLPGTRSPSLWRGGRKPDCI